MSTILNAGKHAAPGQHAVSDKPLPSRDMPPPPPPAAADAALLRVIERKLDWLHLYLTTQIAKPWPVMPPWPERRED